MTSSLGIEMVLPDGRTYRPESSVYRDDDNMTDTEYFRSSYERRFVQQQQHQHHQREEEAGDSAVPCPEDFERNVNISDCTSFLDTQRMDRDKIEESLSLVGFLFTLMSLMIFLLDTGSDVVLAYFLLKSDVAEEREHWFKGTAIIVIASALIVNFFSLKWYVEAQTVSWFHRNTHTKDRPSAPSVSHTKRHAHNPYTIIVARIRFLLLSSYSPVFLPSLSPPSAQTPLFSASSANNLTA